MARVFPKKRCWLLGFAPARPEADCKELRAVIERMIASVRAAEGTGSFANHPNSHHVPRG
jgi:hypothetical protein